MLPRTSLSYKKSRAETVLKAEITDIATEIHIKIAMVSTLPLPQILFTALIGFTMLPFVKVELPFQTSFMTIIAHRPFKVKKDLYIQWAKKEA